MAAVRARLCSRNASKLREFRAALPGWELEPLEADDYPPEDGETYYENARGKALYGRRVGPPDVWMIGEDTGVEVVALGGAPGIASARWADDGPARLLEELDGIDDRRARFVTEIVCVSPEGHELHGRAELGGTIVTAPKGSAGFGYDPVFVPDGETRTVAELGDDWKSRNSNRARVAASLRLHRP